MMWRLFLSCIVAIDAGHALTLAVCGANGGLGRELVYQSLERGVEVVAAVRRPVDTIDVPCRRGWLSEADTRRVPIRHENLTVASYMALSKMPYDVVVFTLSGRPFARDDSYATVADVCDNLPARCSTVALVSAWGVGDSLEDSNVGIRVMNDVYLKSVYDAKNAQEEKVRRLQLNTRIFRPKVLSYSKIPLNPIATPRQQLASDIIDWIEGSTAW